MSYNQQQQYNRDECGCIELESDTQKKTINKLRDGYCKDLYQLLGEVRTLEVRKEKLSGVIEQKQCWFVWTEQNYRTYRNLEMMIGIEIMQTGDSIKEGVKNYLGTNKQLADALKKMTKTVTDIRKKTEELASAACNLDRCLNESCNCSQKVELTGVPAANCKDQPSTKSKDRPKSCNNVEEVLNRLICMPKHLYADAQSIEKSVYNTLGIQSFSNTSSLDGLQNELTDRIKKFDKLILDTIKRGEGDIKTSSEDLTKSTKELAKTTVELYAKRSDFQGVKHSVSFYCCAKCDCVLDDEDPCKARLYDCECDICKICDKVKITRCSDDQHPNQQQSAKSY